ALVDAAHPFGYDARIKRPTLVPWQLWDHSEQMGWYLGNAEEWLRVRSDHTDLDRPVTSASVVTAIGWLDEALGSFSPLGPINDLSVGGLSAQRTEVWTGIAEVIRRLRTQLERLRRVAEQSEGRIDRAISVVLAGAIDAANLGRSVARRAPLLSSNLAADGVR